MPEIGEEEIARAIALELAAFRKLTFPDSSIDILPSEHARATGIMIAVVQPALERARREERERCLAVVNAQTPDWVKERSGPYWDGYREAMEDAADDIRNGSGE